MGDVILTTPALKILRSNFPEAEIHYCTKFSYTDLIRKNPYINKLIGVVDDLSFGRLKEFRKTLAGEKYDLIIDLHKNPKTFYLRLYLRNSSKWIKFRKYSIRKFLLVNFKLNTMKHLPAIAMRYTETLEKIGIKIDKADMSQFQPEIFTDKESKERVQSIFEVKNIPADKKLICIIPFSRHFTKTYPADYFAELINKFDSVQYSFVLIGEDKKLIDTIISKTGENVISLCDTLDLTNIAELMKKCSLVISGDTGPMHIAESINVPLVMIAGSSVREFGFFPVSEKSIVIENNGLSCRPCSHIGRDKCPRGHFKCMKELTPEMVHEKCEEMI
jgi:heptosyltransferase-2